MDVPLFPTDGRTPQPRDQVKIEEVIAQAYPDRYRVYIEVKVTPFRERPNLLLVLRNRDGRIISELNVIETMHADMEFTMHIRNVDDPTGDYELTVDLFYETRNPSQDSHTVQLTIPEAEA
jgi:hypothetical protein